MSLQALAAFSEQRYPRSPVLLQNKGSPKGVEYRNDMSLKQGKVTWCKSWKAGALSCGLAGTLLFHHSQQETNVLLWKLRRWACIQTPVFNQMDFSSSGHFTFLHQWINHQLSPSSRLGQLLHESQILPRWILWMAKLQDGHWFSVGLGFLLTVATK